MKTREEKLEIMIRNRDLHFSPESEIIKFQEERLRETLEYLKMKSPFYQRVFKENSIDILQIKHLTDLHKLPVTTKDDLQKYNDDFILLISPCCAALFLK